MIEFKQKATKNKILFLFSIVIVFFGFSILPELNNQIINEPIEDKNDNLQPKPSAEKADITNITLVQGGKEVEWTPSNQAHFNCGAGPYSIRFYMGELIGIGAYNYRLKVDFSAFYPNFDVLINIVPLTDIFESNPSFLTWILNAFGTLELPVIFNQLSQTSIDVVDPLYNSAGGYYEVSPEGDFQWDAYVNLWDLLKLFPESHYKNVQSIEYELVNHIDIKVQRKLKLIGIWWNDVDNGVTYDGDDMDELHMEIKNEDVTGPLVSEAVPSQEDKDSNVEITCDLADEEYGSGVLNATLYYSIDGGSYLPSNMLLLDDGFYHGSIPPPPLGSRVTYYISSEDRAGNVATSITYVYDAEAVSIPPVIILLLGILGVVAASVIGTVMYRRKNRPAIITLPKKNKVEKYYKKISKEEGTIGMKKGDKFTKNNLEGS